MTDSKESKYASHRKLVWLIYSLITVVVIVLLVTLVARDAEEQFFYGFMTAAGAYVLRPSEQYIARAVLRIFGTEKPAEPPVEPPAE